MSDLAVGSEGGNGPGSAVIVDLSDFGATQALVDDRTDSEGLEPRIPVLIRHGRCGKGWTGASRGHCSGCHETFSSGAFDMHQRIKNGIVTCSTDRLTPSEKPWGTLWSAPNDGEYSWGKTAGEEDAA